MYMSGKEGMYDTVCSAAVQVLQIYVSSPTLASSYHMRRKESNKRGMRQNDGN
jgi:hypothetical protein